MNEIGTYIARPLMRGFDVAITAAAVAAAAAAVAAAAAA